MTMWKMKHLQVLSEYQILYASHFSELKFTEMFLSDWRKDIVFSRVYDFFFFSFLTR